MAKDKITKDIIGYHLQWLVASDKSKIWKTDEFLNLTKDVEQNKPQILKQLDELIRSKSKNKNAKKAMAW